MAEKKGRLSPEFKRVLEKTNYFHDWDLKDFYVANTGKMLLERSRRGYTTVQLEFCTINFDVSYVVLCINATELKVSMQKNDEAVSTYSFTNFGCCYEYKVKCIPNQIIHEIEFEGDAKISIVSEKVKCKKIMNNFSLMSMADYKSH